MKSISLIAFICLLMNSMPVFSQVNCSTLDINKVPGKWVWAKAGFGSQWNITEPIRKELQRIMPVALEGLHATSSIAFGDESAFFHSSSPSYYENYLMLKKFECLRGYNTIQPEGETGCWVYFVVNSIQGNYFSLPGSAALKYYQYESFLYVTHIEVETDAAGNKVIYTSHRPGEKKKLCWYFSARPGLPVRKISRKELYITYKTHHEKRLNEQISKFEKLIVADEKKYNSLTPAQKKEQAYWPDIIRKNKEFLAGYTSDKNRVLAWYADVMQQTGLDNPASVQAVNPFFFYPDKLEAKAGEGYPVWVDDPAFFDKTKPKDLPQCIAFLARRQDEQLPKKNFMDLFFSQFNLDILNRLLGEAPKKPGGTNTLSASLNEARSDVKEQQNNSGSLSAVFGAAATGTFPAGWKGMNNSTVQPFENKTWLAMDKNGYWFPAQYNRELKDNFALSFDLAWDKKIPYSSGLFTVTLGEIPFDNAAGEYKTAGNSSVYMSLYDGYAGNFNRVVLWFDPNWNGGGSLTVYSYDNRETLKVNKRILLPGFFQDKNRHRVQLQRRGNALQVLINDKMEADIDNVFLPAVRYNIFTFSRYKGTEEKADVFYLDQVKAVY